MYCNAYIALLKHSMKYGLDDSKHVHVCMNTKGHIEMFDTLSETRYFTQGIDRGGRGYTAANTPQPVISSSMAQEPSQLLY